MFNFRKLTRKDEQFNNSSVHLTSCYRPEYEAAQHFNRWYFIKFYCSSGNEVTSSRRPRLLTYLLTYLLTHSMVQSPSWAANWFAASQEIPRISWNPKVHYRTHKRPSTFSTLGQPNPVHIPTSHLLEIHPNIIHPSTPRSPQWSHSLRLPHQDPIDYFSKSSLRSCTPWESCIDLISPGFYSDVVLSQIFFWTLISFNWGTHTPFNKQLSSKLPSVS